MNSERLIQVLNLLPFDRRRAALIEEMVGGCYEADLDPETQMHTFILRTLTGEVQETAPVRETLRAELKWISETTYAFLQFSTDAERMMEFVSERGGLYEKTLEELSPAQYRTYRKIVHHAKQFARANGFEYLGFIPAQFFRSPKNIRSVK